MTANSMPCYSPASIRCCDPYENREQGTSYGKLKVHIRAPIPPQVRGRTLVIARADHKTIREEPARTVPGDMLDLEVEIPSQAGVSLTIK
jgi:hypothetical protein